MPVLQKVTYPNNISGLYSWIDNNDLQIYPSGRTYNSTTTYSASTLYDKSGNGNNMIPFTGSGISSFTTKETNNGNTVLRNNMRWRLPFSSTANTQYTMFYVTAFRNTILSSVLGCDNAGGGQFEMGYNSVNKRAIFFLNFVSYNSTSGSTELNQLFITTARVRGVNTSTCAIRYNGRELTFSNTNPLPAFNNIFINWRGFTTNNGVNDFGEFIIYNRYLNDTEVKLIERYLMWKWKITERI